MNDKTKEQTVIENTFPACNPTPEKFMNKEQEQEEEWDDTLTCAHCDKPAEYNYQKSWVLFKVIDGGDDYEALGTALDQDPTDDDNLFLCRGCLADRFGQSYRSMSVGEIKRLS